MPFAALLAVLLASPLAAQAPQPSPGPALGRAREILAGWAEKRLARRDAALAAWISGGPRGVETRCGAEPCPAPRREELLFALAGWLERMPRWLAGTRADRLVWTELAGGAPDGEKDGRTLRLVVPKGGAADHVLAHELSHLYHEDRPRAVAEFLALRLETEPMRKGLAELWLHVWRGNAGRDEPPYELDARGRALLAELRLPRRHPADLHAAAASTEYWAVSVELAYRAWRAGDWAGLSAFLCEAELARLRALFPARIDNEA